MPNHIHLTWQIQAGMKRENVQRDFLKYTAQRIKDRMALNEPFLLSQFLVNAKDRKYQLWERNPLTVDLWSEQVMIQKTRCIHENREEKDSVIILVNIDIHQRYSITQELTIGVFSLISGIN